MHGISGQMLRSVNMAQQIEWFVNLHDEYIQITGLCFDLQPQAYVSSPGKLFQVPLGDFVACYHNNLQYNNLKERNNLRAPTASSV
jgi:hypothetical protein